MGYVRAPFGISYLTHGVQFNKGTDSDYMRNDHFVTFKVKGMANNVVEMVPLNIEEKLRGKTGTGSGMLPMQSVKPRGQFVHPPGS